MCRIFRVWIWNYHAPCNYKAQQFLLWTLYSHLYKVKINSFWSEVLSEAFVSKYFFHICKPWDLLKHASTSLNFDFIATNVQQLNLPLGVIYLELPFDFIPIMFKCRRSLHSLVFGLESTFLLSEYFLIGFLKCLKNSVISSSLEWKILIHKCVTASLLKCQNRKTRSLQVNSCNPSQIPRTGLITFLLQS